jgi:hypothetical protein
MIFLLLNDSRFKERLKSCFRLCLHHFALAFVISLLLFSCQQQKFPDGKTLVLLNNEAITLQEFRRFYELDPNFGIDSAGTGAVMDELHKMIDYKRAYLLTQQQNLVKDSAFQRAVNWEKSRAILRELYRDQVEQNIVISEDELRAEFMKSHIQVHVRHLFSTDSTQIVRWREEIEQGRTFEDIASQAFHDTILAANGGDLGWITPDQLDPDFAEAVQHLKKNEISQPVKTRWGYHLIQLLDRNDDVIISEDDYLKNKPALYKRLKASKGMMLSKRYIAEYIGQLNPQPVRITFAALWEAIAGDNAEKKILPSPILLDNRQLLIISRKLLVRLNEPLIRYQGGEVTLGQYLIALRSIPQSNRPRVQQAHDLSKRMGVWIRDELLLEEAYRKKIDKHESVKKEVLEFAEQQSYLYFLQQEYDKVKVSPKIAKYFENKKAMHGSDLQSFHTLEEWKSAEAEKNLHGILQNVPMSIQVDTAMVEREAAQIDWTNRVRMFAIPKPE